MKYRHSQYKKGWWACFIAFCETNEWYAAGSDISLREVLQGAGVTKKELDYVIKHEMMTDNLKSALVEYQQKMPTK